jgi:acyl-coenzyme A thioesterase PaaI-like protein
MKHSARGLRRLLNFYGPYLGAGVKVNYIAEDFTEIRVSMKLRWYNRNAVSTHFGGSLYAMVDPHLMLMLMKLLGPGYTVWDKSAAIDFVRPGTGTVSATICIDDTTVQSIKEKVAAKRRYEPEFDIEVVDDQKKLVCRVKKILYVRKKRQTLNS